MPMSQTESVLVQFESKAIEAICIFIFVYMRCRERARRRCGAIINDTGIINHVLRFQYQWSIYFYLWLEKSDKINLNALLQKDLFKTSYEIFRCPF